MSAPLCPSATPPRAGSIWPLVISQLLITQSNSYKQQLQDGSCSNRSGKAAFPLLAPTRVSSSVPLCRA